MLQRFQRLPHGLLDIHGASVRLRDGRCRPGAARLKRRREMRLANPQAGHLSTKGPQKADTGLARRNVAIAEQVINFLRLISKDLQIRTVLFKEVESALAMLARYVISLDETAVRVIHLPQFTC